MTTEEKAKAYDEALKEAVIAHKDEDRHLKATLERIFPELAESEDERIRKEILNVFKQLGKGTTLCGRNYDYDKWIAWLEKQGDKDKLIKELGEYKVKYTQEVLSQQLEKQGGCEPVEGEWPYTNPASTLDGEIENIWNNLSRDNLFTASKTGFSEVIHHFINWLEKQGEQKPNPCEQKPNPYSGTSFEYNGHIWGMCARDGGAEVSMDGNLKAFISSDASFIYPDIPQPNLAPKSALEEFKEEKADNANKVEQNLANSAKTCKKSQRMISAEAKEALYDKPAWSEEDEVGWTNTMIMIKECASNHYTKDSIKLVIDWLKSIKQRIKEE